MIPSAILPVVQANSPEEQSLFAAIGARATQTGKDIRRKVESLLDELDTGGWETARQLSLRFDKQEPREIPKAEWQAALETCSPPIIADLRAAAQRIEDYQRKLVPQEKMWRNADGGQVGQLIRPFSRVGVYVPGGTAAYPSSVLMTVIPARAAGVPEIIMVTPPGDHCRPEVLAAAEIAGVSRLFAIGGVQAIAALAKGLGPVPPCDIIAGPGNAYVQEAKRQMFGQISIDCVAGPSEILVLCDDSARPQRVAADLLSQAEHDPMAGVVLVTTDPTLPEKVCRAIETQLQTLPRQEIARAALGDYGAAVVCRSEEQAVAVVNRAAPEHLEIMTRHPQRLLPGIRNAGAVFLGEYAPEPLGDYWAGPSHVLPTAGSARFFSALSAETFLKKSSLIAYDKEAFGKAASAVARLARAEGLEAHARSADVRKEGETDEAP